MFKRNAERRARVERAKKELELTAEIFESLAKDCVGTWAGTRLKDTDIREKLWAEYVAMSKVHSRLVSAVAEEKLIGDDND